MSEMPVEQEHGREAGTSGDSSPTEPGAKSTITVDLDRKLDERLGWIARWQGVSEEDLLAAAIERHPKSSAQRSLTVQVSEAAAARLAATAATLGMSAEQLIAEAINTYSPPEKASTRFWPAVGFPGLLLALSFVLMVSSPRVGHSGSAVVWTLFAAAVVVACCAGALVLVSTVIYPEWFVIKYGIAGLVSAAGSAAVAVLSVFAYVYWLLSNLSPGSFNLPMSRMDAFYFTLGTFTTTGTGRFAAQSSLAEVLVSGQVVFGWGFVAVLLALLVPRAAAAYKSRSAGRIVVRIKSPGEEA